MTWKHYEKVYPEDKELDIMMVMNVKQDLWQKIVLISTPGIIFMPNLRAVSIASGMPDIVSWSVRARTFTCSKYNGIMKFRLPADI